MRNLLSTAGALGIFRASPYLIVLILGGLFSKQTVSPLTIYITFIQFGAVLVGLGLPQLFAIQISAVEDVDDIDIIFAAFTKIAIASQIALFPAMFFSYWLLYGFGAQNILLLSIALTAALPLALAGNISALYIRKDKTASLLRLNSLFFLILSITLISIGYAKGLDPAVSAAAMSILYWLYFFVALKPVSGFLSDVWKVSALRLLSRRWRPALYNLLASLVTPLGILAVNSIILRSAGTQAQADFYLAYAAFALLVFVPNALTQKVLMKLSSLRWNVSECRSALRKVVLYHAAAATIVIGFGFLLHFYCINYTNYSLANNELPGFLFSAFIFYLISPMSQALVAIGMERQLLGINVLWLASIIVLTIVCLDMEAMPVSTAYLVSFALVAAGNYYCLKRKSLL